MTSSLLRIYKYTYTVKATHSYQNICFCVSRKMAATSSAISVGLLLLTLCLGIVYAGGSDFQSSIAELRMSVADQQDTITELKREVAGQSQVILEQAIKITKQEDTIQQLEQKLYEQEQRLDMFSLQLQLENSQSQVNNTYIITFSVIIPYNNIN